MHKRYVGKAKNKPANETKALSFCEYLAHVDLKAKPKRSSLFSRKSLITKLKQAIKENAEADLHLLKATNECLLQYVPSAFGHANAKRDYLHFKRQLSVIDWSGKLNVQEFDNAVAKSLANNLWEELSPLGYQVAATYDYDPILDCDFKLGSRNFNGVAIAWD